MHLAKPYVDIGLNTNNLSAMLSFWQHDVGAVFDHVLPIRRGVKQHRHDIRGSVLKINNHHEPLPARAPSGYAELLIARDDIVAEKKMQDPDGNAVRLVPSGTDGIRQIGIRLRVRSASAHRAFLANALELDQVAEDAFRAGETLIHLEQSPSATGDASVEGPGWRYITFQVFKVDQEHARILERGGQEAMKPTTLGSTARISMIRDPDGNWIEISQRASLVGSLV